MTVLMQDSGLKRVNPKDQYYTHPDIAYKCIQEVLVRLPELCEYYWIEPSAGDGSFFNHIPPTIHKTGLDIDPAAPGIIQQDFLIWNPKTLLEGSKNILVIGNPPFGRQSSLAKAFIVKSCSFASVIAFILPRSFTKPSMFKVFDSYFHCFSSTDIGKNAFLLNGLPYHVPCVFQIWIKKHISRPKELKVIEHGFQYVKLDDTEVIYNMAIRRVGGLAGKAYRNNGQFYNPQSHYFIRLNECYWEHIDEIMKILNSHRFPENTVGPRSLSKTEINQVLNGILVSFS